MHKAYATADLDLDVEGHDHVSIKAWHFIDTPLLFFSFCTIPSSV